MFLAFLQWDITDYLPTTLAREGLRFYVISPPLWSALHLGSAPALLAGQTSHRAQARRMLLRAPQLAPSHSCSNVSRVACSGGPKRQRPEAATVSWRWGRLEEMGRGIQSRRGRGRKQHCGTRRVQAVVKWTSTCRYKAKEQNKKGAREALLKEGLS